MIKFQNPIKKEEITIMSKKDLDKLDKNVLSRKREYEIRSNQEEVERAFKQSNKKGFDIKFDKDKLKTWAIIITVAIFGSIILHRMLSKFGIL